MVHLGRVIGGISYYDGIMVQVDIFQVIVAVNMIGMVFGFYITGIRSYDMVWHNQEIIGYGRLIGNMVIYLRIFVDWWLYLDMDLDLLYILLSYLCDFLCIWCMVIINVDGYTSHHSSWCISCYGFCDPYLICSLARPSGSIALLVYLMVKYDLSTYYMFWCADIMVSYME